MPPLFCWWARDFAKHTHRSVTAVHNWQWPITEGVRPKDNCNKTTKLWNHESVFFPCGVSHWLGWTEYWWKTWHGAHSVDQAASVSGTHLPLLSTARIKATSFLACFEFWHTEAKWKLKGILKCTVKCFGKKEAPKWGKKHLNVLSNSAVWFKKHLTKSFSASAKGHDYKLRKWLGLGCYIYASHNQLKCFSS